MFDLRYHVASLAAVFVALLVGILVGVGISQTGKVDQAEKNELRSRVSALETRLEAAGERRANLEREREAAQVFIQRAYPLLIKNRLKGKRIALLFVGSVDKQIRSSVSKTLSDAGAHPSIPVRMRALKVPIDVGAVDGVLAGRRALASYKGDDQLGELGTLLGGELVNGGETPGWDALSSLLVEEQDGGFGRPVDAIVVVRTVRPQEAETARFLNGLYGGLGEIGVPAVGVETSAAKSSAVEVWRRAQLSTVDDVETRAGRLALALLLAGGQPGRYGVKEKDVILPPVDPLPAQPGG